MARRRSAGRSDASPLEVGVLVQPAQALLHRRGAEVPRVDELALAPIDPETIVCPARMLDDALGRSGDIGL
ncbi:MAG: hypothetical protein H0U03_14105 [Actinobacteria bacterium]|nr:hypothetical protein [Actinomycetota bacterium]